MLRDIDVFAALVNNPTMPIQFVFAGKSHPHDGPGKAMLREIAQLARDPRFAGKLVFVEDYDINVGRRLVQGVDVWINNPRRPLEACGTSGQKIVLNGGLNLSILDGWWAEAYDGVNGFAIGMGETHTSADMHDARDGDSLLVVLRDVVVPLYYNRDRDGLPRVDRARETRDPHAWLALQRGPHAEGLPAQNLHSGGGRHEQRREPHLNHGTHGTIRGTCTVRVVRGLPSVLSVLSAARGSCCPWRYLTSNVMCAFTRNETILFL
jgi:hypothetical protein